ncbi:MAG TPA: glycosyltransferase family 4 protein [Nitrospirota bacterium]|nr:glycosyltransferase family 4 protein [Nitrospirota bacterium]
MNNAKKIGIITRALPPELCGIGDHSVLIGESLKKCGHDVYTFAGKGEERQNTYIIDDKWDRATFSRLIVLFKELKLDLIILQYTPLMYLNTDDFQNSDLIDFWASCRNYWETALIVHETYFRVWWYPSGWIKGTIQKRSLKLLANLSVHIFSASHPLVNEIESWENEPKVHLLPIGSNFPIISINREKWRLENNITKNDIVLVLFGGGMSLKWLSSHVKKVDSILSKSKIRFHWLLLGGVPREWFHLTAPVISPGKIPAEAISAWLQASDIFLMPHYAGVCSKRGTLMAAMQHGLPVVGTWGSMTDAFWKDMQGVSCVELSSPRRFAEVVLKTASDNSLRQMHGLYNRNYYCANLTWEHIAEVFLKALQ